MLFTQQRVWSCRASIVLSYSIVEQIEKLRFKKKAQRRTNRVSFGNYQRCLFLEDVLIGCLTLIVSFFFRSIGHERETSLIQREVKIARTQKLLPRRTEYSRVLKMTKCVQLFLSQRFVKNILQASGLFVDSLAN